MAEIKIRHGLAYYVDDDGHQHTVFRGQVIDIPSKEADRLKLLGAAVDADEELPVGGRITPIPNTASDEELIAWCSVATKGEIVTAISEHPQLGDRILAARDVVQKRLEDQNDLLSGVADTVKAGKALAKKKAAAERHSAPTTGTQGKNASVTSDEVRDLIGGDGDEEDEEGEEETDGNLQQDDPRSVVRGNVGDVSKFLNEHPDQAEAILEAEKAHALDKQVEPRPGVIKAVEAAVSHRTQ